MKTSNFIPLLFLTIPLSFFFACTQDNKQEIKQEIKMRSDSTHSQKKIIFINTFTSSPETDSCACFFSTDSTSYHNQSYIFAYNLSTLAYMKINGEMITFKQTEYIIMGKNSVTTFTSETYSLFLELKDVKETGKEATLQWGSIRVMDSDNNAALTPFYGGCMCKKPL